jgi:hypothetical protein
MSNEFIGLLIFIGIILFLIAGIIYAINSKNTKGSGSYASMAAFHDMQTGEKQRAIEYVIENHAEKKWKEEENGENSKDDKNVDPKKREI